LIWPEKAQGLKCLRENRNYGGNLGILTGSWWVPPASAEGAGLQSSGKAFHLEDWALQAAEKLEDCRRVIPQAKEPA
jgi:hypothetical protein